MTAGAGVTITVTVATVAVTMVVAVPIQDQVSPPVIRDHHPPDSRDHDLLLVDEVATVIQDLEVDDRATTRAQTTAVLVQSSAAVLAERETTPVGSNKSHNKPRLDEYTPPWLEQTPKQTSLGVVCRLMPIVSLRHKCTIIPVGRYKINLVSYDLLLFK